MFIPLIAVLIIALSGGTSLVAEQALPHTMLYPIKVQLNEEIRSVLNFSAEAQADWTVRRIERRLEEAEQLAVDSRLDAATRVELEIAITGYADQVNGVAESLANQSNLSDAITVWARLEAGLRAHAHILLGLATPSTDTASALADLTLSIADKAEAAHETRTVAESKINGQPAIQAVAEGRLIAAQNKSNEVHAFFDLKKSAISPTAVAEIEILLSAADTALISGQAQLGAQMYTQAFLDFQEAQRIAQEAQIMIAAAEKLGVSTRFDFGRVPAGTPAADSDTLLQDAATSSVQTEINVEVLLERARNLKLRADQNRIDGSAEATTTTNTIDVDSAIQINAAL